MIAFALEFVASLFAESVFDRIERRWPGSAKWLLLGGILFLSLLMPAFVVVVQAAVERL
jgi:hypothetical protein